MARSISAAVGKGCKNNPDDVKTVKALLNPFAALAGFPKLKEDEEPTPRLFDAIGKFQQKVCGFKPDYKVEPRKTSMRKLNEGPSKVKAEEKAEQKAVAEAHKQAIEYARQAAEKAAKAEKLGTGSIGDLLDRLQSEAEAMIRAEIDKAMKTGTVAKAIAKILAEVNKSSEKTAAAEVKKAAKEEEQKPATGKKTSAEIKALWKLHVTSKVKTIGTTKKIIENLLPYLEGTNIKIVSGYLNNADQFWKVNHHWDYLRWICKDTLTRDITEDEKKTIKAIVAKLESNKPNPVEGYKFANVGEPEDKSSYDQIRARWSVLKGAKSAWKKLCDEKGYATKGWKQSACYLHPQSPIAKPGTSNHGHGYAIDMTGDYGKIKEISRKAGATLIYTEPGNMHIEFKNGVKAKS